MKFFKNKKNCLNCHFFTKENNRHSHSLTKVDRENKNQRLTRIISYLGIAISAFSLYKSLKK